MRRIAIILCMLFLGAAYPQSSFTDTFDDGNTDGWLAFSRGFDINPTVSSGHLNINYSGTDENYIYLFPPVGAVTGDMSCTISGSGGEADAGGIARFSSIDYSIGAGLWDDTLWVFYSDGGAAVYLHADYFNVTSGSHTMTLDISGSAPNITVTVKWDGSTIYSGTISGASERLNSGHVAYFVYGDVINFSLDQFSLTYIPFTTLSDYSDDFDDGNYDGWLCMSEDFLVTPQIINNKLSINYSGPTDSNNYLYMFSPLGAVENNFAFTITGSGTEAGAGGIARMYSNEYIIGAGLWDDTLWVFYGNSAGFTYLSTEPFIPSGGEHTMSLEVTPADPNLNVNVLWDGSSMYSGQINSPSYQLKQGHLCYFLWGEVMTATFDDVVITSGGTIKVDDQITETPSEFKLEQNFPNPFNPLSSVNYQLGKTTNVVFTLYNASGEKIKEVLNENKSAGNYQLRINSEGLASGVYFLNMKTDYSSDSIKLVLLK